jgi:ribosomal protein L11 methylase PrmA
MNFAIEYWQEPGTISCLQVVIGFSDRTAGDRVLPELADLPVLTARQERWRNSTCIRLLAKPQQDIDRLLLEINGLLASCHGAELLETSLIALPHEIDSQEISLRASIPACWDIVLNADSAFGSGSHPSTRLAAQALNEWLSLQEDLNRKNALDVGTGSGILALICGKAGLGATLGLDICRESLAIARKNVAANGLADRVSVRPTLLTDISLCFDLILANLTPVVLSRILDDLANRLKTGATLIIAGFQGRQAEDFEIRLTAFGLNITGRYQHHSWRALRVSCPRGYRRS